MLHWKLDFVVKGNTKSLIFWDEKARPLPQVTVNIADNQCL